MSATVTASDEGKRVVHGDIVVGRVAKVLSGTAFVAPDPDLADVTLDKLGWDRPDDGPIPLADATVDTVTEVEVRLRTWVP